MESKKYVYQYMALEDAAKNEIVELLKNNPKGRYIQPNEHHDDDLYAADGIWALTGNEDAIFVMAVGLHDDGVLRVKAEMMEDDYMDYQWFEFDDFTHCYCELYEFVVNNLDIADQEPIDGHGFDD